MDVPLGCSDLIIINNTGMNMGGGLFSCYSRHAKATQMGAARERAVLDTTPQLSPPPLPKPLLCAVYPQDKGQTSPLSQPHPGIYSENAGERLSVTKQQASVIAVSDQHSSFSLILSNPQSLHVVLGFVCSSRSPCDTWETGIQHHERKSVYSTLTTGSRIMIF